MRAEEYDEFAAAPYKTIVDKFLPRVCAALEGDPIKRGLTLAAAFGDYLNQERAQAQVCEGLNRKYGYCAGLITNQRILAPFDFLADQLRGFKSITMDIRRMPDKIKAVLEVVIGLAALLCNGEDFEDMETFRQEREQLIFFPRAMNRTLARGVRVSARP